MAGIYIHIPFCKKLCFYCDFYHIITQSDNKSFIDALIKEAACPQGLHWKRNSFNNIYWWRNSICLSAVEEINTIIDNIRKLYSGQRKTVK